MRGPLVRLLRRRVQPLPALPLVRAGLGRRGELRADGALLVRVRHRHAVQPEGPGLQPPQPGDAVRRRARPVRVVERRLRSPAGGEEPGPAPSRPRRTRFRRRR